jgi:hypothetical protein
MRLLVPGLVLALLALALAGVAAADHARKQSRKADAWVGTWLCEHEGRSCGGVHPSAIERRWDAREEWYVAGASILLLAAPVGLLYFGTRGSTPAPRRRPAHA